MKKICSLKHKSISDFVVYDDVLSEEEAVLFQQLIAIEIELETQEHDGEEHGVTFANNMRYHCDTGYISRRDDTHSDYCKKASPFITKIARRIIESLQLTYGQQPFWDFTLYTQDLDIPSQGMAFHIDSALNDKRQRVESCGTAIHYLHEGVYKNDKLHIWPEGEDVQTVFPKRGDTVILKTPLLHSVSSISYYQNDDYGTHRYTAILVFNAPQN